VAIAENNVAAIEDTTLCALIVREPTVVDLACIPSIAIFQLNATGNYKTKAVGSNSSNYKWVIAIAIAIAIVQSFSTFARIAKKRWAGNDDIGCCIDRGEWRSDVVEECAELVQQSEWGVVYNHHSIRYASWCGGSELPVTNDNSAIKQTSMKNWLAWVDGAVFNHQESRRIDLDCDECRSAISAVEISIKQRKTSHARHTLSYSVRTMGILVKFELVITTDWPSAVIPSP
jgi:hypothetical protein